MKIALRLGSLFGSPQAVWVWTTPLSCAPSATRTRDLLLRRQLLYPLSYRG
jgi:hypothetical protein